MHNAYTERKHDSVVKLMDKTIVKNEKVYFV